GPVDKPQWKRQRALPNSTLTKQVPPARVFATSPATRGSVTISRSPSHKLWRGRTFCSEVSQTARDASKATAEVACSCELCFDRLSRAVRSGYGAGSVGRAADAVGHEDLRVLSVRGADKHHAEVDQRNERRQDRRLLAPMDGAGARENA